LASENLPDRLAVFQHIADRTVIAVLGLPDGLQVIGGEDVLLFDDGSARPACSPDNASSSRTPTRLIRLNGMRGQLSQAVGGAAGTRKRRTGGTV